MVSIPARPGREKCESRGKGRCVAGEAPDDFEPESGAVLTHLLIARDADRSRGFYERVLGAWVVRERGPCVLRFHNSYIVLNDEGGPTDDKPDVQAQALSKSKMLGSDDHLGDPRQRGPRAVALGGKVRPAGGLAAGADRLKLPWGWFPAGRRLLSSKGGRA